MAYTATLVKEDVVGSQRMTTYNITADAASGSVTTSFGVVYSAKISPISMATAAVKVKVNTTVASAASNGTVFISSAASGDNFFIYVYGA